MPIKIDGDRNHHPQTSQYKRQAIALVILHRNRKAIALYLPKLL
ncbi:hypothetical protein [Nostoc sp. LEGE 06077]|nr:hypothetical protein [Nostoc sp. LEGE 06077]